MKELSIMIILLIIGGLASDYSKSLQDEQIKEKIVIIDKAKTSNDSVVIQSAEVAKAELKTIADKKIIEQEKQKQADKPLTPEQQKIFSIFLSIFVFLSVPLVFSVLKLSLRT